MMKSLILVAAIAVGLSTAAAAPKNSLSTTEKADGWRLLFNGKNLDGWRTYGPAGTIRDGWQIEGGLLVKKANTSGGDIMTKETFVDFEFTWEWNLAKDGNNGVKYFIIEERKRTIGHEYQILDDFGHPDGKKGKDRQVAGFYDVLPPSDDKPRREPGKWNQSRLVVKGNQVEHWLNGAKVLAYECGSKRVLDAVQESKFKKVEGFGMKVRGHILLTDHKDECKFRNLKLRELK
ncbi:MAG: 3-keto-disaccharide hydrolase [Verrucomicrobiia bacterium]|jgi:hypothetical protein